MVLVITVITVVAVIRLAINLEVSGPFSMRTIKSKCIFQPSDSVCENEYLDNKLG